MPLPHASTLLRQLRSNLRRSLGQREVAVHGVCLLLLVALQAFAASSPLSVLIVLGMLWALRQEQRHGAEGWRSIWARLREDHGRADQAREQLRPNHNDEDGPWK